MTIDIICDSVKLYDRLAEKLVPASNVKGVKAPFRFICISRIGYQVEIDEDAERAVVFIDGNNLYHRLKESGLGTKINIGYLASKLVGDRKLVQIYYYNSPHPGEGEKSQRENEYYSYIRKTPNLTFRLAWLQPTKMFDEYGEYKSYREKGCDTALTTDLISLAAKDFYDVAIIVSNDGDYAPAVKMIKKDYGKQIEVVYFRGSKPFVMEQHCVMRLIRNGYLVGYKTQTEDTRWDKDTKNREQGKRRTKKKEKKYKKYRLDYDNTDYID